jgi:hypothetical protein
MKEWGTVSRVTAKGRVRDTDSPHRGGQAVARAAKIPHSTWPKQSPITPVRKSIRHSGSIDGAVRIEATEPRNQNRVIAFVAFFYDSNESVDKVAKHICRAAAKSSKVNAHLLRLDEVSKTALTCFVCEHDVPVRHTRDREDELHVIEISAPFGDRP